MTAPAGTQLASQRATITERLIAALSALFAGLGSWRDADATQFTRQAVPLVQGAQQALAGLVSAYLAQQASQQTGHVVPPPVLPPAAVTNLRGVPASEVYTRPFKEVWAALAQNKPLNEAVQLGTTRLTEIAEGDLQTTYAHANQQGMQRLPARARPQSWRRVLQGPSSCALCVLASTHHYTIRDLNPIHPGCDCTVEPAYGTQAGSDDAAERVHAAVQELTGQSSAGGRAVDYRQIQITQTHGELGPMLARPGDHFTGPSAIPST